MPMTVKNEYMNAKYVNFVDLIATIELYMLDKNRRILI